MTEQPALFDGPAPIVLEVREALSAGRRLTLRQREQVAAGIHPLTGQKAAPELGTCGQCRFRVPGRYAKCHYRPGDTGPLLRVTHGPATDVRAWWPACPQFQPIPLKEP